MEEYTRRALKDLLAEKLDRLDILRDKLSRAEETALAAKNAVRNFEEEVASLKKDLGVTDGND